MKDSDMSIRFKAMEKEKRVYLENGKTYILRMDGKKFSSYLDGFVKPFDEIFRDTMNEVMLECCKEVSGAICGFTNSDEITVVFRKNNPESEIYLGGECQKIVSVMASFCSTNFNRIFFEKINSNKYTISEEQKNIYNKKVLRAVFDARVFQIENDDFFNNVVWRFLDCYRNSISGIARCFFSSRELESKTNSDRLDMLNKKGIKLSDYKEDFIYGTLCYKMPVQVTNDCIRNKWFLDKNISDLEKNKWDYIEKILSI